MSEKTTPATEAFREGTKARANGRKLAENPYDLQTEQHIEWSAGWSATFDLDEERDPESTRLDESEAPESAPSLPRLGR